jgi:hypothetical protein
MTTTMEINIDIREMLDAILSDGLHYFGGYGIEVAYDSAEYRDAKQSLLDANSNSIYSFEDILTQIVMRGGALHFIDVEGDGEYTTYLNLDLIKQNLPKVDKAVLIQTMDGDGDAGTADTVLQQLLYGEVIFG